MSKTIKNKKKTTPLIKTRKYYGGDDPSSEDVIQNTMDEQIITNKIGKDETQASINTEKLINDINNSRKTVDLENNGIIDKLNDTVLNITESSTDFLKEKALRLFGLKAINDDQNNNSNNDANNDTNSSLSNIVNKGSVILETIKNNVVNDLDKAAASSVIGLNEVLKTPQVQQNFMQSSQETLKIGKELLNQFSDNLSDPETKRNAVDTLNNIAEYSQVAMDVLDEPINQAVDKLNEVGNKAASGVAAGIVKVATDAIAAVPGVGAVVDIARMVNDTTSAASAVVAAGSVAAETGSELFINGTQAIKTAIQVINDKKNEATNISNRTNEKIKQFQNPALYSPPPSKGGGGKKSKKRLIKRNIKSKRVRFSV